MYCLVDFRNRPQYKYAFRTRSQAGEYIKKIKNNPLGVTAIHADGRREYFENGLPAGFFQSSDKTVSIKKGCYVKYHIRELQALDGINRKKTAAAGHELKNWRKKSACSLFMLGNRKIYAGLALVSLLVFSGAGYFQSAYSNPAAAESGTFLADSKGQVLGASDDKTNNLGSENSLQLADEDVIMNLLGKIEDAKSEEFETEILKYVKGRPMEDMAPFIAKQPRIVAAFLVGIAMKESKFGVYSPKLGGRDCHNYWGFKGGGTTASGGYTCFDGPEEAIRVVGKRISRLVDAGRTNPSAMVVWKCGSSCSWDNPENVRKWIADVGVNFYKINSGEKS